MDKIYFAMGLHFHQPVGNFEKILERAYQNCYSPFLDTLFSYKDIKMALHFSGNLLDYFEDKHPDFLDKLREMVARGQVEIMGGGYYEPIFQAIPQRDRIGQIEMASDYSEKRFGMRPIGVWTPERVWFPEIISDFLSCNLRYSILDEAHLIKADLNQDDLHGYFMAGYDDEKIAIFPSSKTLRYIIPFKSPHETIYYLRKIAKKKQDSLLTYGDDGEKFGEWPWTYDWVYKKGWLNNFFKELMNNRRWLEVVSFSDYLHSHPALKDLYIPEASYEEMMEWAGGSWMNFLSKYPESNQMHKKMLYVSNKINELESRNPESGMRNEIKKAKRELYKGQTNCAYWHGVFGGIYLYHLRNAVYRHLITADRIVEGVGPRVQNHGADIKEMDFYGTGKKAVILENKDFFICVEPAAGGIIRELDYKIGSANLVNTLTRRKEPYHRKILERLNNRITEPLKIQEAIKTVDEGIRRGIFYDKNIRASLVDHFIDRDLKIDDFANSNYVDRGNFVDAPYAVRIDRDRLILSRQGTVGTNDVYINKGLYVPSDKDIEISYIMKNRGLHEIDALFGIEFNITLPYADSDRYCYASDKEKLANLDKSGCASGAKSFSIKDSRNGLGMEFMFSQVPEKVWYFPVMTVSQSERAYDLSYQSSCILPMWRIDPGDREGLRLEIRWRMARPNLAIEAWQGSALP